MAERGLCLELMRSMFLLATMPFSLFKSICLFCLRTAFLAAYTWILLVKGIIIFQLDICCTVIIWTLGVVSLPLRILNALQRERLLEAHLHELLFQLENLAWEKMEAEELLRLALKDCRIVETILVEVEEEHEKAIARIGQLENELRDLKDENLRSNEVQGKGLWDFKLQDVPCSGLDVFDVKDDGIASGTILQDVMAHGEDWEDEIKGKTQSSDFLKTTPKTAGHIHPFSRRGVPKTLMIDGVLEQRKQVALSQSLFSAIMSVLVGMIIWEAEDACTPLVVALFTVVGISLASVVQFFSTIKNRPASEAVALLSFNCFILGTLTYPTLPRVAHMLAVPAVNLMDRMVGWIGLSAS